MKLQSRHEKQMGQVCLITDEATWGNKSPSKLQSLMMFQVMVLFQQCYNWNQTADIHKQSHNHLNKNYTIIFNNDSQHSKIQSRAKTQKHEQTQKPNSFREGVKIVTWEPASSSNCLTQSSTIASSPGFAIDSNPLTASLVCSLNLSSASVAWDSFDTFCFPFFLLFKSGNPMPNPCTPDGKEPDSCFFSAPFPSQLLLSN